MGTAANVADQVAQATRNVADVAVDQFDNGRRTAAGGLDTAATALRDTAGQVAGGERLNAFAQAAADRLNTTADYVRKNDANQMLDDVAQLVKDNPKASLLIAASFGFVIGRAVTRN
jgi:ElaB/YqjD/DUF883 family membrane-anchored ribosome-binding protein